MEVIGNIWSFFVEMYSFISCKQVFSVAAPVCLLVERSIQYYYLVNDDYGFAGDKRKAILKYRKVTLGMIAFTVFLFWLVFYTPDILIEIILISVPIWYVYTLVLMYYFVGDYLKSRRRDSKPS